MNDYKCEECERSYGLLCLTPVGKGQVQILCGYCFGETLVSGIGSEKNVYLPSAFMGDYREMMSDNKVVFYNVIAWQKGKIDGTACDVYHLSCCDECCCAIHVGEVNGNPCSTS